MFKLLLRRDGKKQELLISESIPTIRIDYNLVGEITWDHDMCASSVPHMAAFAQAPIWFGNHMGLPLEKWLLLLGNVGNRLFWSSP